MSADSTADITWPGRDRGSGGLLLIGTGVTNRETDRNSTSYSAIS